MATASPRQVRLALDVVLIWLLFWGAHDVYKGSKGHTQISDSQYSLAVSEQLLAGNAPDLTQCVKPGDAMPYQLTRRGEAVYYGYPLGSSILSLPFVQRMDVSRGLSLFHLDGRLNAGMESLLQLKIAADLSAAVVVLFYVLCRFYCPPVPSAAIALAFAFGSPVWSTLSRALWSHTWMVALLSLALVLLEWRRRRENATRRTDLAFGIALGTVLFWMLFTRAHGIFSVLGIGCFLLLHHRRLLLFTGIAGALWVGAFVAISLEVFGTPTPPSVYSLATIDGHDVLNRFAWLMVSPSRGLLIYCPYLLVLGGLLVAFRDQLKDTGLLMPAGVAIATHTALFSCYDGWHMGSSYGPRYFADLLPWFVLIAAIGVRALLDAPRSARRSAFAAALVLTFAWGISVHSRGANSVKAWFWNWRAIAVGHESAVKEWDHPQFLSGITFEVKPDGHVVEK